MMTVFRRHWPFFLIWVIGLIGYMTWIVMLDPKTIAMPIALCLWTLIFGSGLLGYFVQLIRPFRNLREESFEFLKKRSKKAAQLTTREMKDADWAKETIRCLAKELQDHDSELRKNNDQLNGILSSMNEGVIALNHRGKVVLCNEASREMLAITADEFKKRPLAEICRVPQLLDSIENCNSKKQTVMVEFETHLDPRRILRVSASPLARKKLNGIVLVIHDVTELRQLETMRQDFVTNVSHELKTPLASIKAYAETLTLGAIDEPSTNRQFVEQIELAADRLSNQINDLLRLSQVESRQAVFDMQPVDMVVAASDCLQRFRSTAKKSNVELLLEAPQSNQVIAICDRDGLDTILDNLVSNAIRYTPENGKVTISFESLNNESILKVNDTGIGIPADKRERIFERFYRVDEARSRDAGGTGLGLSIVKHLVNAFGGQIELESQLGRGSTFLVKLKQPGN